jgi:hypothetical protein
MYGWSGGFGDIADVVPVTEEKHIPAFAWAGLGAFLFFALFINRRRQRGA